VQTIQQDREIAQTTRRQLLDRIAIIAACHFPAPGFGRVCQDGSVRVWQPLELEWVA
jgi:hypothetical protein